MHPKDSRDLFRRDCRIFCCAHLLVLHTNLHDKLCLILLPLMSVTKLPQILAGTASNPILLMVQKQIHIFLSFQYNFLASFLHSPCLEECRPCGILIYNMSIAVTAINYNVKVPRTVLLQFTNSSWERRILLNFTEGM